MNEDIRLKAMEVLRQEFGEEWLPIVQALGTEDLRQRVGKDLTSFMAFPERGEGGKNTWRGNCSPRVIEAVVNYVLESKRYYGKDIEGFTLLDPMSGGGTSKAVADKPVSYTHLIFPHHAGKGQAPQM